MRAILLAPRRRLVQRPERRTTCCASPERKARAGGDCFAARAVSASAALHPEREFEPLHSVYNPGLCCIMPPSTKIVVEVM